MQRLVAHIKVIGVSVALAALAYGAISLLIHLFRTYGGSVI